jgi:hypothetical protein
MAKRRASVFIGSSAEGLRIAKAIQVNLDRACEVVIWSQGVFGLSEGTLETLVNRAGEFDFAILVVTPDDMTHSRGKTQQSPRDNVLLELGLFVGTIGRKRTFAVYDRAADIKMPSDLAGATLASFEPHSSGNFQAAVGAACTQIETAITELGLREKERVGFEVDQGTQFQIICDLLDRAALQFLILMHEQNLGLRRESLFGSGVRYQYVHLRGHGGNGHFSVNSFCEKLPDSGLLQIDLRNNVTLTGRGHQFASWLVQHGHKAEFFNSDVGGWGGETPPPYWPGDSEGGNPDPFEAPRPANSL